MGSTAPSARPNGRIAIATIGFNLSLNLCNSDIRGRNGLASFILNLDGQLLIA
jgi:hypothetical protein